MNEVITDKKPDLTLSRYQVDKAIADYCKKVYPINNVYTIVLPDGSTEVYFIK